MATGKALDGKPYAGNPHVRFDDVKVAPAATPRRGSLLYSKAFGVIFAVLLTVLSALGAVDPLAGSPEGERVLLWPDGMTPCAESHQYESPFIEWFVPSNKTTDAVLIQTCGGATRYAIGGLPG